MPKYLEIRKDNHYTENLKYNKIDRILANFNVNQDKEYGRYYLILNNKNIRIELLRCDKNGNYDFSPDEREKWDSFNMIEVNIPKEVNQEEEELLNKIINEIARLLQWEIFTASIG